MVTVAPGQNSAAPRSERGAVLPSPQPVANGPERITQTESPSPELPNTDAKGRTDQTPTPSGSANAREPQADARVTQIVAEARDLQGSPGATLATTDMVSLPDSNAPNTSRSVALPEGGARPKPVFLTNADRAQAIAAYETAQNLTESGRILPQLGGDASPPERQAA